MLSYETGVALALLPAHFRSVLWRRSGTDGLAVGGSLEGLLVAHVPELDATARAAIATTALTRARRALARAHELGLATTTIVEAGFPAALRTLPDPPLALWYRGALDRSDRPAVAVVGSRAALPPTLDLAETLGCDLAERGVTVVSGLARGVDSAAHKGALVTGRTVAVFGSGIDHVYPPEHQSLAEAIVASGALVSELPPGTPPRALHFPLRNRIIAGLSVAVVVVEASERSGSLSTARYAIEQGREVMVVPGSVASGRNRGGHALLRDGALLVESARDVIEGLPGHVRARLAPDLSSHAGAARDDIAGDVARDPIARTMVAGESYAVDDLLSRTRVSLAELLSRLSALEIAGLVRRVEGGRYLRPNRK